MPEDPVPDLRQQRGPHAFVEDLDAPRLDPDDHHHLAKSLRLRDGDSLTISDAQRRWRCASFAASPSPIGPIIVEPTPEWPITIAFALTKSGKPELVVQKATELGVDHIVVFGGDHSVPRWDSDKRRKAQQRLDRVAREAAMQSRRVDLPQVEIVDDLAAVTDQVEAGRRGPLARADFVPSGPDSGTAQSSDAARGARAIAVGPEGGWSEQERLTLPATFDLGPTVLRSETAALAAVFQLTSLRQMGRSD
ncbi:MAG: 16S rRNA (uracil(1498)-N(3))-methyltransferase [Actinomycetota bacterium]